MKKTTVVYAIAFALSSFGNSSEQLQEVPLAEPISDVLYVAFTQPKAPPDAPKGRERGTGSRSPEDSKECSIAGAQTSLTLTPLIPSEPWGYTTSDSPRIWVNIKYNSGRAENAISGQFSLQDPEKKNKELLRVPVTLPQESSGFSIHITHSLQPDKMYRWYLALDNCPKVYVQGWIQRVTKPELQHQLEEIETLQERFALYYRENIWYDALNEAANIDCSNQQKTSLDRPWATLLSDDDIKLQDIAQTPLTCPQS